MKKKKDPIFKICFDYSKNPHSSDANAWVDFAEILCLTNPDKTVSRADIATIVKSSKLGGNTNVLEFLDESTTSRPEEVDKISRKSHEVFNYIGARIEHYKEFYPFRLSKDRKTLYSIQNLTRNHYFYIFLLFCSNLRLCDKKVASLLTANFENLTLGNFRSLFPHDASFISFGTKPKTSGNKIKKDSLLKKLEKLSKLIDLPLRPETNETNFPSNNTGDGGIDHVGWITTSPKDPIRDTVFMFGQCACGEEWEKKTYEVCRGNIGKYFSLNKDFTGVFYMPRSYRNTSFHWVNSSNVIGVHFMDRYRILFSLKKSLKVTSYKKSILGQ